MTEKITLAWIRRLAADQGLLPTPGPARTGSREVSFSTALQWIAPFIEACPSAPPPAFSPQWQDEPDEQVRFVSVMVAALLWALHTEVRQDAMHDASQAVAEGVRDTTPTPASSARHVAAEAAQAPFLYPPARRSSAA